MAPASSQEAPAGAAHIVARAALGLLLAVLTTFVVPATAQTPQANPPSNHTGTLKFSFGRYWNGCGPVDQPESGITLTTVRVKCTKRIEMPPPPFLNVQFFAAEDTHAGPVKVLWWRNSAQSATVVRCLSAELKCDQAVSGTIDFGKPGPPEIPPSYELKFADGSLERGTFTARASCHRVQCW